MPDFVASCNIRLYRYSGEPNRLVKTDYLSNFDGTVTGIEGDYMAGTFRTPLDFVHPTLYIESDKGFPWNYLRLQSTTGDYGVIYRYYFVTKVTCINFNMYEVECIEDVLTTFGAVIKNYGYGFVERCEFDYDPMIPDDYITLKNGIKSIDTTSIGVNAFNDYYIENDTYLRSSVVVTGIGFEFVEKGQL